MEVLLQIPGDSMPTAETANQGSPGNSKSLDCPDNKTISNNRTGKRKKVEKIAATKAAFSILYSVIGFVRYQIQFFGVGMSWYKRIINLFAIEYIM